MRNNTIMLRLLMLIVLCPVLYACPYASGIDAHAPAVAHDPVNNRYLAVYVKVKYGNPDASGSTDDSNLLGAFVDKSGVPMGNEFSISKESGDIICPFVVFDSDHQKYLVIWNFGDFILGQLINADGSLSGSRFALSNTAAADCGRCSSATYDSAVQKFAAVWGERNTSGQDSVYAQLISPDGTLDGPKLAMSADGAHLTYPSIAYDGQAQRFFVVWEGANNTQLKGRLLNPDGTFAASEFLISTPSGTHYVPTVVYNSVDARFLVAWDYTADNKTYALLGQMLNTDGSPYQSPISISSPDRNVYFHAVAYNPSDNDYFVLFGDRSQALLYGQVVKQDGTLDTTIANDNILISDAGYPGDWQPAVAYDSLSNRYLAGWEYHKGFYDIHSRVINANGSPAGDIAVLANGGE